VTPNDDPNKIVVHYGDKVITVGDRFDKLDKQFTMVFKALIALGIGELLMIGIHLPETAPILAILAKLI